MDRTDIRIRFHVIYAEGALALLLAAFLLTGGRAVLSAEAELARGRAKAQDKAAEMLKAEEENEKARQENAPNGDGYPIMGESQVTWKQLADYFLESGREYPSDELSKGGAESIETFCTLYCEEAQAEGVRPEVAFAQTMKETGFLQYGGDASVEQFNFAGIGTTGGGVPGNSYKDVRTGIRAQIQHLKAYASTEELNQECVDERYGYVRRGSAPYVEWLGQKENPTGAGWATGENYGYDIVGMIQDIFS